eukprot:1186847-Prorocentrum_minimum.AAC.5
MYMYSAGKHQCWQQKPDAQGAEVVDGYMDLTTCSVKTKCPPGRFRATLMPSHPQPAPSSRTLTPCRSSPSSVDITERYECSLLAASQTCPPVVESEFVVSVSMGGAHSDNSLIFEA